MNPSISTFRFALLASALAFSPLAGSLAQAPKVLKVKIPFAFQNGSQSLPAGVYIVTRLNSHLYSLEGAGKSGLTMGQNEDSDSSPNAPSKLVFQRYGDKYFLREVWRSGSQNHTVCLKTSEEIKAQKAARSMVVAANTPALTVGVSEVNADR